MTRARQLDFRPLRMGIEDLIESFGDSYPRGQALLRELASIQSALAAALKASEHERVAALLGQFDQLQRQALLANPLLDFERMLLIRRKPDGDPRMPIGTGYSHGEFVGLPRQASKHNPGIDRYFNWDNEIAMLSMSDGSLSTVYKPERPKLINDLDLHWDADRILFSMPGSHDHWHVFEASIDGPRPRQVSPSDQKDVHFYDACYLPSGRIAVLSTACMQGVPCNAGVIVGLLYTMKEDGTDIRQITFEQDHDYCPRVMNDGRILYLRWDYTDTPHVWNRMLFTCNPDGTAQAEFYGANSYWPNAIFYARPVPDHPTRVVGIVTGHHLGRVGELTIFDPALGRFEADGVVQQIPGYGRKVEPKIEDKLTEHSWPKSLHPWPLSEKYFLVSAKPTPDSLWGIYLVDVFDNMTLIKELEGQALLEPIPVRRRPRPPVIPDRVKPDAKDATVYLADVYSGPGMTDIPRGTVKQLRLFSYHFAYQRLAGIDHRIGADGPWEPKRVLGMVDVEADGSAMFKVPARTPFTVQPLDADGRAVQLMRTWMTAMPGETLSCVGCHDNRGGAPPGDATIASSRPPQKIRPWYGPARGFSFSREVQPVLDRHCVGCHDGQARDDGKPIPDLRGDQGYFVCYRTGNPNPEIIRDTPRQQLLGKYGGIFDPSYIALRRYVRVGGLESDLHLLPPMEFHADTSELVQMLRKGHHGVQLDAEAWDRLITWIDLNAPAHGTWGEMSVIRGNQGDRRLELQRLYGGLDEDYEQVPPAPMQTIQPIIPPQPPEVRRPRVMVEGWPFDAAEAQRRQQALGQVMRSVDLGGGVTLELVRIPGGRFVMGDQSGDADERPQAVVSIGRPLWMGRFEVTNEQYRLFDPAHDSRFEHRTSWIFSEEYLGWALNEPKQPVVRVSWQQAMRYCDWLSAKTGLRFTLPTEAQWEYACRAGSEMPMSFGDVEADFSPFANLADASIRELAWQGWRPRAPDLAVRDSRYNDGYLVTAPVGRYRANAWGLHDMHGNAAEWTRSALRPYPYSAEDGRDSADAPGLKAVRGGSWFDRPHRARSGFRLGYQPYQRIFNVGFRVIIEDGPEPQALADPQP
jgi:formylglycine-generating enzyme required for sulfatase activity